MTAAVPEAPGRRLPAALRRPAFRRLTAAWFTTNIGDSALYLMLAVWVRELTGSDGAAGLVFAALGLPALLAPFAGQIADRVSRRRLLIGTNVAIGLIVLSLLSVDSAERLWLIYAVTFCYGFAGYLTASAQSGLLRDLLDDEELPGATGLFTTIDQGLRLVSPLLGTGLYVLAGPYAVVALTAVCFLATSLILRGVAMRETAVQRTKKPGWRALTAGFRTIGANSVLRRLTIVVSIAFAVTGVLNVVVFPLLDQGLGLGARAIGLIVTTQGVGAVIGGILSAAVLRRIGEVRLVSAGLGLLGVAMLGAATVVQLLPTGHPAGILLACTAMALGGFGIPWIVVGMATYRIRVTPPAVQGRTSAATNMALNAPQTLATIVTAAVIASVDYRLLLLASALAIGLCALGLRPWTRSH